VSRRDYSICKGKFQEVCNLVRDWRKGKGFKTGWGNVPEKLMLLVTELSEAMEAFRKIPLHSTRGCGMQPDCGSEDQSVANFREELADTLIRLMDLAASLDIDLEAEMVSKMATNEGRPHKHGKTC